MQRALVSVRSPLAARLVAPSVPVTRPLKRLYAAECNAPTETTPESIEHLLRNAMRVKNVMITDVSGNGSFFHVAVQSPDFKGLSMLKQHQMVNAALKGALANVHGVQIKTLVAEDE